MFKKCTSDLFDDQGQRLRYKFDKERYSVVYKNKWSFQLFKN